MKFQFISIPVHGSEEAQAKLNQFCAQHKIADIERQFINHGGNSHWAFCLSYDDGQESLPKKQKIDYKEILNESDFAIYAKLRELRKILAETDGVPPYNIFTNEQLATIIQRKAMTITALSDIDGVGKSRLEKYGEIFIEKLNDIFNAR